MLGGMSKRRDSAARWREIVRGHAESGLSVAAYCRRTGVPQSSFFAWRRKLRDAATFAEVRVAPRKAGPGGLHDAPAAPREANALEVRLAGGRCIVVRPGFDPPTFLALVASLERGAGDHAGGEAGV